MDHNELWNNRREPKLRRRLKAILITVQEVMEVTSHLFTMQESLKGIFQASLVYFGIL